MKRDSSKAILPISRIDLSKVWWFERGIGQYYIDGDCGSAGFFGKYNIEDIGNILYKTIETAKLDRKISNVLGANCTKTGILMKTDKENYAIKKKQVVESPSEITLVKSGNDAKQVDLYIEGLNEIPFGSDGEATLYILPQIQLAMDIWDRSAKIITSASLYFDKEVNISRGMAYMHELFDAEKKIFKKIRQQIPRGFNLGNVCYWVNIPGFGISDIYFLTAFQDISVRTSEEGRTYLSKDKNLKTVDPYLVSQLNLLHEYVDCDPMLKRQRKHPNAPDVKPTLSYTPPIQ